MPNIVNRTAGVAPRNGTNTHTLTFPDALEGSLLVAVVGAGATTTWPAGWNERESPVNFSELSIATRIAQAGDTQVTITHNAPNYPANYVIYEFTAGSTWAGSVAQANTDTWPTWTGASSPVTVFGALSRESTNITGTWTATWVGPWVEDYDHEIPQVVTGGHFLTVGYLDDVTTGTATPACTVPVGSGSERVTFAVQVVSAADTTAPSVPAGLTVDAVSSTTADVSWAAATDNVGVTGYEVQVTGP